MASEKADIWEESLFGGSPQQVVKERESIQRTPSPALRERESIPRSTSPALKERESITSNPTLSRVLSEDITDGVTNNTIDIEDDDIRNGDDDFSAFTMKQGDPVIRGSAGLTDAEAVERRTLLKTVSLLRRSCQSTCPLVLDQVPFLAGEVQLHLISNKSDCFYLPFEGSTKIYGSLILTNYMIYFFPSTSQHLPRDYFQIPLACLNKAVKTNSRKGILEPDRMTLSCKDGREILFGFNSSLDCRKMMEVCQQYAFHGRTQLLFAFTHYSAIENDRKLSSFALNEESGWQVYDAVKEYTRLGLIGYTLTGGTSNWRLSTFNKDYKRIEGYPLNLIVPKTISDETMLGCSSFRSKSRLPACVWVHPLTNASITRSSQPCCGIGFDGGSKERNADDEAMVKAIWEAGNSKLGPLIIADCRPKANALANRAQGMGYEGENYPNTELIFLNIHNIHVMRDSYNKLSSICSSRDTNLNWGSSIEGSDWLFHVRTVLDASFNMARYVHGGRSVFVHCSDGWDRTAQICGLMQLILDPYYRTYHGFQILISKEWLSFGHRFQERLGHGDGSEGEKHRSPVFLQFLDCVYQLLRIFPRAFEFLPIMLTEIADCLYNCRFGTFLCNCERERLEISKKTESLWSHLDNHQRKFGNPLYVPHEALLSHNSLIVRNVILWDYHLRFSPTKSIISSAASQSLPKLGPLLAESASGDVVTINVLGNTLAANSVGMPLSCNTAASDDEWTFRALLNEVAKAKAFARMYCRNSEEIKKIEKYDELQKKYDDVIEREEKLESAYKAEIKTLKSTIMKLEGDVISLRDMGLGGSAAKNDSLWGISDSVPKSNKAAKKKENLFSDDSF